MLYNSPKICRAKLLPVSVNKTLVSREPLTCNTAAGTAIQPLSWCFVN